MDIEKIKVLKGNLLDNKKYYSSFFDKQYFVNILIDEKINKIYVTKRLLIQQPIFLSLKEFNIVEINLVDNDKSSKDYIIMYSNGLIKMLYTII